METQTAMLCAAAIIMSDTPKKPAGRKKKWIRTWLTRRSERGLFVLHSELEVNPELNLNVIGS